VCIAVGFAEGFLARADFSGKLIADYSCTFMRFHRSPLP
jgi:hypothetical protein